MLYYIESMLPENWETEWDINSNGTPDFFETYTALYAYSELCKEGGEKTKYGYLDETVDTYFMSGYLFTYGGYIFGNNGTDASDIGLASGESYKGARMIQQWAGQMNNTEILDTAFSSAAYQYLANGTMLCTITTPDGVPDVYPRHGFHRKLDGGGSRGRPEDDHRPTSACQRRPDR